MSLSRISIFIIVLLFATCKKTEDESPFIPSNPDSDFEVPTITPSGDEQFLNMDSDYIFDQSKLATFELKIPGSALAQINANPAAEQYVEGMLIFEGDTISPVGVRYKGSIGAFVNCLSGSDWANPSGQKICTKLSMKVKINWDGADYKFYGLKKLQFHSQNQDNSQMRERLGYWLFRDMGVPAPRSVHARLMINGKYSGLYALTEQIDGRFAKYNFEDDDGNLYKEIWPLNMNGQPFSEQTYLNHLKTNEDESPSAALIRDFAQEIANASPTDLQAVIANRMDIQEIISYAVVDRTIRHDDGPFHWYCGGGSCSSHNFYWYEEPTLEKLHLIPWDLDNAFENIIFNANPVTPIADAWGQITANCAPFEHGAWGLEQWSASCDKLTGGWASFETEYEQILSQFKNNSLAAAQINVLLSDWENQIRAATLEAEQTHDDALSVSRWEIALGQLKGQLDYARDN